MFPKWKAWLLRVNQALFEFLEFVYEIDIFKCDNENTYFITQNQGFWIYNIRKEETLFCALKPYINKLAWRQLLLIVHNRTLPKYDKKSPLLEKIN